MKRIVFVILSMVFSLSVLVSQSQKAIDGKQYWFSEVLKIEKGLVVCGEIDLEKSDFKLLVNGTIEKPSKAFIWRNSDGSIFYRIRLDQGERTLEFFNGKKFLVSTDSLLAVNQKGLLVSGWVTTPKEPFQQETVGKGLGVLLDGSETEGVIYVSTVPTNFMGIDGNFYNVYYFWNGLQAGARVSDGLIVAPQDTVIQGKLLPKNTGIYFQINEENKFTIPFIGNVNNLGIQKPSNSTILLKTLSGEEYLFSLSKKISLEADSQLVTEGYAVSQTIKINGEDKKVKSFHYQIAENGVAEINEIEY